jgi:hypothetical protein
LVEGRLLAFRPFLKLCSEHHCPSLFAFTTDFIYKILRALTRIEPGAEPTFTRLPGTHYLQRDFNDPMSRIGPAGKRTILQELSLTLLGSWPFAFTLPRGQLQLYEDKSA